CNAERRVACDANCVAISVLIVDDNGSFLDAARVLLEREGLSVVGLASTGAEALRQAEALSPDVLLVDITLGRESGFELTRRLVEDGRCERSALMLISTHSEADLADLSADRQAAGFVHKSELTPAAIRRILGGRSQ